MALPRMAFVRIKSLSFTQSLWKMLDMEQTRSVSYCGYDQLCDPRQATSLTLGFFICQMVN